MGLCYRTTRWCDRLWGEHLQLSETARTLVSAGIDKQGADFAGFPADIHARLYLPSEPAAVEPAPEWATRLHLLASELGEWQRLRVMCARNGFAAGIAAEAMLEQLLPHVPDRPPSPGGGDRPAGDPPVILREKSPDSTAAESGAPSTPGEPPAADSQLRAALRRAVRAANAAVQDAEASLEGLSVPLGLSMPGAATVPAAGPADLGAIRDAHSRLSSSQRLKRIAELAGRLERVAASKARSRVKPGVGEVHGIGLGGLADLARLLPAELVGLRRPLRRLHLLARLLQRQALVYGMTGKEPQARGPIVLLLDESSSMKDDGRDIWSKAVALALLSTATKQKRAWHFVAFNGDIVREVEILAGKATPADLQTALDHRCAGGTNFDPPVMRAVQLIERSPCMRQADVVVVTDGESELALAAIDAATNLTRTEGISWFVVGVGPDAEASIQSLATIATSMVRIRQTNDDAADLVAPVINLVCDAE
jgi:Mg-chelatase subunit ChlD